MPGKGTQAGGDEVREAPQRRSETGDGLWTSRESSEGARLYNFQIKGNDIDFHISSNGNVSFFVNGKVTMGDLKGRDSKAAALKLRRIMKEDAATRPNGFQYDTVASTSDTFGATRSVAYELVGFSRPVGGRAGMMQFGIVRDGKLVADKRRLAGFERNYSRQQIEQNYAEMRARRDEDRRRR